MAMSNVSRVILVGICLWSTSLASFAQALASEGTVYVESRSRYVVTIEGFYPVDRQAGLNFDARVLWKLVPPGNAHIRQMLEGFSAEF